MKEGWEYKKLGSLCRIRTGKLDANAADDNGLYPFFTCSATPLRINNYAYDCECVLVAGNGDLNVKYYSGKFNAYQRTYIIESNDNNVLDVRYLYMFLSEYVTILRKKSIGAIIKYIKLGYLTDAEIPLPPLYEQQSIVDYLDAAFAKIDAMKANAEKSLNEAKALFQASLKEMLEPKEGWEKKTIGFFAKIVHGKNQKDVLDDNGLYPIYGSGGNIMGHANSYLCDAGTTILGRKGTIDNPMFIDEKFWNVDTAFGIIAKYNCNKKFLYYSIKKIDWAKRNTGTTLPSLTQNVVYNVEMCAPSLSEQQSIVETLDSLKSKVDTLQANYDKISQECDALKQAILRQVFE